MWNLSRNCVNSQYLVRHLALHIHGQFQHVVVGGAREQDLTCVQLIQGTAD